MVAALAHDPPLAPPLPLVEARVQSPEHHRSALVRSIQEGERAASPQKQRLAALRQTSAAQGQCSVADVIVVV